MESHVQKVIPALRITNYARSKAFYVDGLGFSVKAEHRFGPNFPVFMTISRDGMEIYLTEHAGDCLCFGWSESTRRKGPAPGERQERYADDDRE